MPSAKLVSEWYRQSFEDLLRFEHADDSLTTIAQLVTAFTQIPADAIQIQRAAPGDPETAQSCG